MRYRVHLFATVRVEHELEAESPEAAAIAANNADLHLYERFDRAGQEYAEQLDDLVLVDPLTEFRDELGRQLPDYDLADWYELTHRRTEAGWTVEARPAPPNRLGLSDEAKPASQEPPLPESEDS